MWDKPHTCQFPGCDTLLSKYNDSPYCWAHRNAEPPKGWIRCAHCGTLTRKHNGASAVDPETRKVGLCRPCYRGMYGK